MCPLALLFVPALSGEVREISGRCFELMARPAPQVVLLSGVLSFALNVTNFTA
jgi:hypothetical protein